MEIGIQLDELYPLQAELDQEIHEKHGVDYPSTFERRVLALLVEVGEFANETRCFKFWSLKGPSPKEKILDEYADGMHFFLSLGYYLGYRAWTHYYKEPKNKDLSHHLLEVYGEISKFRLRPTFKQYEKAFGLYLDILPLLGISGKEAKEAYRQKLGENHVRQDTGY